MEKCNKCQQVFSRRNNAEEKLKCGFCGNFYHGICQDIQSVEVLKYLNGGQNTIWNCMECISKREFVLKFMGQFDEIKNIHLKQESVLTDIRNQLSKQIEEFKNFKEQIKLNVNANTIGTPAGKRPFASLLANSSEWPSPAPKRTKNTLKSADKVKSAKRERDPILIVKHDKNDQLCEMKIKESLNPLKDPVNFVRHTKNNYVIVHCKNKESVSKVKEKLEQAIGSEYDVNQPKDAKPKLKLIGIPKEINSQNLLECIGEQNNINMLLENIKIERISKGIKNTAIIECSNIDTYKSLLSKKKLFIMWSVVYIEPYINIGRCYLCQNFGHNAEDCEIDEEFCSKCGDNHSVIVCKSEKICCINCSRANERGEKLSTDHYAWSRKCPAVQKRFKIIKERFNVLF